MVTWILNSGLERKKKIIAVENDNDYCDTQWCIFTGDLSMKNDVQEHNVLYEIYAYSFCINSAQPFG